MSTAKDISAIQCKCYPLGPCWECCLDVSRRDAEIL